MLFLFQTPPTYLDSEYTLIKLEWQKTNLLALFLSNLTNDINIYLKMCHTKWIGTISVGFM